MASNSFGNILRITTFGESHGKAIGVVVDGLPSGIFITNEMIQKELQARASGMSPYVSPRKEKDEVEIISGIYQEKSTGAPICLLIHNHNADQKSYQDIQNIYRPGHANFTYLQKYGIFDPFGGGRASARETAARVAAGALAKAFLLHYQVEVIAFVQKIYHHEISSYPHCIKTLRKKREKSSLFCIDEEIEKKMQIAIEEAKTEKDSLGGCVEFYVENTPLGLGDPIYEKLEANLAKALMSIPATKAFEIGESLLSCEKKGSNYNDSFYLEEEKACLKTNHAGGILGGISTGNPIFGRVYLKPTSSIQKPQKSVDFQKNQEVLFTYNASSRHDPCVAIRAVSVVEAMVALVIADALLLNKVARL